MANELDDKFYERADEHIDLSNEQKREADGGKVSASMLYAAARFNAWITATWHAGAGMAAGKADAVEFFVREYRTMLEENLDDYIANSDAYMKSTT